MEEKLRNELLKQDFVDYIWKPINENSNLITSIIIGTVIHDVELKTSKNNNNWTEIKVLVESEHPRRVQLKLFGDSAKEAVSKYHKGDILFIVGEPKPNSFICKSGKDIVNRLDVFPVFIKKIGNKEVNDSHQVILK